MSDHDDVTGQDRLLDHRYDGIQEFDNPLPGWWVAIYWLTILFVPVYIGFYHFGKGTLPAEDYARDIAAAAQIRADSGAGTAAVDEAMLSSRLTDAALIAAGEKIYIASCAVCHSADGGGLIGPNLTDDYHIHGGALTDIYRTIHDGVPEKGMVPWAKQLKPEQLVAITTFVAGLNGTTPAAPKAPEGELLDR